MRTIKFRAWDKERKTMLNTGFVLCPTSPMWSPFVDRGSRETTELIDLHQKAKGNPFGTGGCWIAEGGDYYGMNLIVMQFTGLLDKNGEEIYEGDVVKCYRNDGEEVGNTDVVGFENGAFFLRNRQIALFQWDKITDGGDVEVVGNIYE